MSSFNPSTPISKGIFIKLVKELTKLSNSPFFALSFDVTSFVVCKNFSPMDVPSFAIFIKLVKVLIIPNIVPGPGISSKVLSNACVACCTIFPPFSVKSSPKSVIAGETTSFVIIFTISVIFANNSCPSGDAKTRSKVSILLNISDIVLSSDLLGSTPTIDASVFTI